METCETRVRITTKAMRLISLAASCLIAHGAYAATWTGANGTDLADPLNWSGDVYSTEMQFSSDAALTLNNDTNVFRVFGNSAVRGELPCTRDIVEALPRKRDAVFVFAVCRDFSA